VPDRRSPWLARIAAATVVVLVVVGVTYLLTVKHVPLMQEPTSCTVAAGRQELGLTVGQAAIAATIAGVAARRDLPVRAVTIAYAAALQESKLADLDYGDRDSVGVFQQRPSQGWGTPRQIENPVYASGRFFGALVEVPGYQRMPVYEAAQAVQRSADGYAYDQYAAVGEQLADAIYGATPHAFWCYYTQAVGKPRLAAANSALASTFGRLGSQRTPDPGVAVLVPHAWEGWAVAAWLISRAASYDIGDVRYQGYEWLRGHGSGTWQRLPASARTQAGPDTLVFD
jgi:hypothetical protein